MKIAFAEKFAGSRLPHILYTNSILRLFEQRLTELKTKNDIFVNSGRTDVHSIQNKQIPAAFAAGMMAFIAGAIHRCW